MVSDLKQPERDRTTSVGGNSTLGKNTIKKLGFQMAKSSHINFYDHWKYDVKICKRSVFLTTMKGLP